MLLFQRTQKSFIALVLVRVQPRQQGRRCHRLQGHPEEPQQDERDQHGWTDRQLGHGDLVHRARRAAVDLVSSGAAERSVGLDQDDRILPHPDGPGLDVRTYI